MRKIEYLSPTAIGRYVENPDFFYQEYLSDIRPPRDPQTQPMSIGSAFDAYAKSFLYQALFGKGHDPRFELKTLFEAQVEKHNRDWAWQHGKYAFEGYKASGALNDLMIELNNAIGTPRFEFEIKGVIEGFREGISKRYGGVTLLGKPDVFYLSKHGIHVNLDWKVNGWCSKYHVSPVKGYIRVRTITGVHQPAHKDAMCMHHRGVMINVNQNLEQCKEDWARQLTIYSWLCGVPIGDDSIIAVDQIVCSPTGMEYPNMKVAEHRTRIGNAFQWRVFTLAQDIWDRAHSDHYFRELSKEDSQMRCRMLDETNKTLCGQGDSLDKWFLEACSPRRNF